MRAIHLGGRVISFRFQRGRRGTIGLYVDRNGLAARAPRWVTIDEVERFMREHETWILAKLVEIPAHSTERHIEWREGAMIPVLGLDRTIKFDPNIDQAALDAEHLLTPPATDARALRETMVRWLAGTALELFRARVSELAPKLGVPLPRIALSTARTQWGSCTVSRTGEARIRLHWRLIHLRQNVIDYVVAHELAHIREMNHSVRFWRWVESVVPDYKLLRRELRTHGRMLPEV